MTGLSYSLLTEEEILSAVDCVTKVFLYEEPMAKVLDITGLEFKVFAQMVCKKAAKERMSYICKNDKNKVVGFCLNEDLIGEPFDDSVKITPKMNPVFGILNELDQYYLKNKRSKNYFFHLFMVGSDKDYRSRGIAKELTKKSLNLAHKKGFKTVITEATGVKSQELFRNHFNFNDIKKIKYKGFKFGNTFPFKDIDEESCNLMELKLRN